MADAALAGRTAFITGGSGSIGGACAERLLRDGAAVLLMARNPEALERKRAALREAYPAAQVGVFAGDACSEADVRAALAAAHALRGQLDIVVPTVGGGGGFRPLMGHDAASFQQVVERNLTSTFLAVRYAASLMEHGGSMVCLSATSAVRVVVTAGELSAGAVGSSTTISVSVDGIVLLAEWRVATRLLLPVRGEGSDSHCSAVFVRAISRRSRLRASRRCSACRPLPGT